MRMIFFRFRKEYGFTMIELLATVIIMSTLAIMIAPMGTIIFFQDKEIMLKENLREIRRAIDKFYDTNTRVFKEDSNKSKQHYYPFTWQDLYEGYLRKAYALNPITRRFEDYDVILDKNGIFWSKDYFDTMNLSDINDMYYPEVLKTTTGGSDSIATVHLSPQRFKIRQFDSVASKIELFAGIKWLEAGMFDVRFPSPDNSDPLSDLYRNQTSIDGKSLYKEW